MFLGYQIDEQGNKLICNIKETREELENDKWTIYSSIEETNEEYKLFNGKYITIDEYLAELKKAKHEEINEAREKAQQTDSVPFNEDLFDINETTQRNILGLLQFAQSNPDITTFIFRSRSNINHQLTAKQLADLGVAITLKIQEIYQKSWELKAKVDKALTEKEINNIKWEE